MASTTSVYVELTLPSGSVLFLLYSQENDVDYLYHTIRKRVKCEDIMLVCKGKMLSSRRMDDMLRNYMDAKGRICVELRVVKSNLYIDSYPVVSIQNYALDTADAYYAFTRMFDDFDGKFEGRITMKKDRYHYIAPKGKKVLPWIALDGNVYYILAGKDQRLADVLIPDDDCELDGMTIVEKKTGSDARDLLATRTRKK